MSDDFYGFDDGEAPKGGGNLFLWTIFILLLIGLAFGCWLGSFYIFGHPERPGPYRFLKKLGKIESPQRFEVTAAPQGEFLSARKLFDRYSRMTPLELDEENAQLLRIYIKNYRETKRVVTYVTGRFLLFDAYTLKKTDFFSSGVVALAQSVDYPQVMIEHLYPSGTRSIPALQSMLQTGLEIKIEKTLDLSVLLHVERLPDGHMQFTVVPILYGAYTMKQGAGTFALDPPTDLLIDAGLPVVKAIAFDAGLKKFAEYRRTQSIEKIDPRGENPSDLGIPALVRVDPVKSVTVSSPVKATPSPTIPLVRPPTRVEAGPVASAPNVDSPPPTIVAQRDPKGTGSGGSWRIYERGKAPAGRLLTATEAVEWVDRGEPNQRIYLGGEFLVTATSQGRAIMRVRGPRSEAADAPRIFVDYPAGALPPAENSFAVRDSSRPLQIRSVQRASNGQLNIYAMEIMQP
jgi:hypothetical protein